MPMHFRKNYFREFDAIFCCSNKSIITTYGYWLGILDTAQGHIAAVVIRVLLLWLGILDTAQGHIAAV